MKIPFAFRGWVTAALVTEKEERRGILAQEGLYVRFPPFMRAGDEATFVAHYDTYLRASLSDGRLVLHLAVDILPGHLEIEEEIRVEVAEAAEFLGGRFFAGCAAAMEMIEGLGQRPGVEASVVEELQKKIADVAEQVDQLRG